MTPEGIQQLHTLKDLALSQSAQLSEQLSKGISPDKLVPLLQTQSETVKALQAGIQELAQETHLTPHQNDIKILQQALKELADVAQTHVQQATKKGVRLTGIGGKPHISPRRPR